MEPLGHRALENRRVVGVGEHRALRIRRVRVPDHAEQRLGLRCAVDDPVGVEDLVAAVLGVGLRKHGQLGVGGIAPERAVGGAQVGDLVLAQRQAEARVGVLKPRQRHMPERPRCHVPEQLAGVVERCKNALGHAVVQQRRDALAAIRRLRSVTADVIRDAALDAADAREAAIARDVGCLGGPGREGSQPRHHEEKRRARMISLQRSAVIQQALEELSFRRIRLAIGFREMPELRRDAAHRGECLLQFGQQLGEAEVRQRAGTAEL